MSIPRTDETIVNVRNDHFVNRQGIIAEIEEIWQTVLMDKKSELVVVKGKGGEGKTTLLLRLMNQVLDNKAKNSNCIRVKFDLSQLDGRFNLENMLLHLRNNLCARGISLPLFDFALLRLWVEEKPHGPFPQLAKSSVISNVESGTLAGAADLVQEFVDSGQNTLFNLAKAAVEKAKATWYDSHNRHKRSKDWAKHIDGLYQKQMIDSNALKASLSAILAADLNFWLQRKNQGKKTTCLVIAIDEFERVFNGEESIRTSYGNEVNDAIRLIVENITNYCFFLIFSRRVPDWALQNEDWNYYFHEKNHLKDLKGIPRHDAMDLLAYHLPHNPELYENILANAWEQDQTEGLYYPFLLHYQVEFVLTRLNRGDVTTSKELDVKGKTFESRKKKIILRILRDYSDITQETIRVLSFATTFDEKVYSELTGSLSAYGAAMRFKGFCELSIIRPSELDRFKISPVIAEIVRATQNEEEVTQATSRLLEIYEEMADVADGDKFSICNLYAIQNIVDLCLRSNPDQALEAVRKRAHALVNAGYSAQALEIMEIIFSMLRRESGLNEDRISRCRILVSCFDLALGNFTLTEKTLQSVQSEGRTIPSLDIRWLILAAREFKHAEAIFDHFRPRTIPKTEKSRFFFGEQVKAMVKKAPTKEKQDEYMKLLDAVDADVNVWVLEALIDKAESFSDACLLIKKHSQNNIDGRHIAYLLDKAKTEAELNKVVSMAADSGITLDRVHFNILEKKKNIVDLDTLVPEFEEMLFQNPTIVTYTTKISSASSFRQAYEYFTAMVERGIRPDFISISALGKHPNSSQERAEFTELVGHYSENKDSSLLSNLVHKINTEPECMDFVTFAEQRGFTISPPFLREIIKQSISLWAIQHYDREEECALDDIFKYRATLISFVEVHGYREELIDVIDAQILFAVKSDAIAIDYYEQIKNSHRPRQFPALAKRLLLSMNKIEQCLDCLRNLEMSGHDVTQDLITLVGSKVSSKNDMKRVLAFVRNREMNTPNLIACMLRGHMRAEACSNESITWLLSQVRSGRMRDVDTDESIIRAMITYCNNPDLSSELVKVAKERDFELTSGALCKIAEVNDNDQAVFTLVASIKVVEGKFSKRIAKAFEKHLTALNTDKFVALFAKQLNSSEAEVREIIRDAYR